MIIIIFYSMQSHETTSSASFFINWSISASRATFAISIWRTFEMSSVHLVSKAVSCAPNAVCRTPVSHSSSVRRKDGAPDCFYGHDSDPWLTAPDLRPPSPTVCYSPRVGSCAPSMSSRRTVAARLCSSGLSLRQSLGFYTMQTNAP